MEVVLFLVVIIIMITTLSKVEHKPKHVKEVGLYVETIGEGPEKMFLVYDSNTHNFVCQATTEKELHSKIFGVYGYGDVTLRDENGTVVKITFSEMGKE